MSKKFHSKGFVYIWRDRKRNMYYIGCHVGSENDGYICSSNKMRDAYRRRPEDFKRRILSRNIEKHNLLEEEYRWLKLIKPCELKVKYYNQHNYHFGHWTTSKSSSKTRNRFLAAMAKRKGKPMPHLSEFQFNSNQIPWNKGKTHLPGELNPFYGKTHTAESKEKNRIAHIGKPSGFKGKKHTPETIQKIRDSKKRKSIEADA